MSVLTNRNKLCHFIDEIASSMLQLAIKDGLRLEYLIESPDSGPSLDRHLIRTRFDLGKVNGDRPSYSALMNLTDIIPVEVFPPADSCARELYVDLKSDRSKYEEAQPLNHIVPSPRSKALEANG